MDTVQWYDWIRIATVILAVSAMWRLGRSIVKNHQSYSTRLKDFLFVINIALFTQAVGGLESVLLDAPLRYTTVLSFALVVVAFRATKESTKPLIT